MKKKKVKLIKQNKVVKNLKNLERLVLKIESLDSRAENYYVQLFTNILILAKARGNKELEKELRIIYDAPATVNKKDINLSSLQNLSMSLKSKTAKGNLKVEPSLIEAEVQLKLIFYILIEDLDLNLLKAGVNTKKVNPL